MVRIGINLGPIRLSGSTRRRSRRPAGSGIVKAIEKATANVPPYDPATRTPQQLALVADMNAGMSIADIAAKHGLKTRQVKKIILKR